MAETQISSQMIRTAARVLPPCLVCGAKSSSINFGVPTCPPCKAFFRRNAVKLKTHRFICGKDGDCSVTHESRRLCNCCRLAKCFRVGMQPSLIRSDVERAARKELVEQNRRIRERSLAKNDAELIRPSTLLRLNHNESVSPSPSDQILLTNIFAAYERTCVVPFNSRAKPTRIPSNITLHDLVNIHSENSISSIQFYNLVPQFKTLPIIDRMYLIRNNPFIMSLFNESILNPIMPSYLPHAIRSLFGKDMGTTWLNTRICIQPFLSDPILLKLFVIVLILSTGTNGIDDGTNMSESYIDTRPIFAAQNVYVELLWRYILSRSPDRHCAIKFLNTLISYVLRSQHTCYQFTTCIRSQTTEIVQLTSHMQSVWHQSDKN